MEGSARRDDLMFDHLVANARRDWTGASHDRSWFWRLDARAKLVGLIGIVVATALVVRTDLLMLSLVLVVAVAVLSGVPGRELALAYAGTLPFIGLASVSIFLFMGTEKGIDMLTRTSACVLSMLVLAIGTDTFDLFAGLRRLKVPALITTILMLTQKYIVLLANELSRMSTARKARGFRPGRSLFDRYGLRVLSYTAGMVFVRSSARADRAYEALKARGFDGDLSPWRESRIAVPDLAFMTTLLGASACLLAVQNGVIA